MNFWDFGSGYHISRRLNPIFMYFTLAILSELKIINFTIQIARIYYNTLEYKRQ